MIDAAALLRLMECPKLSRTIRLGPEDCISMDFANRLRVATLERRLRCVWTHVPNELAGGMGKRSSARYAVAKALGMITGASDYLFLAPDRAAAIEMKAGRNPLTAGQRDFRVWCESTGVMVGTARSADAAEALLIEWELLLPIGQRWTGQPFRPGGRAA